MEDETKIGFSNGMVEICHVENGERINILLSVSAAKDLGVKLIQSAALAMIALNMPDNIIMESPVIPRKAQKK